MCMLECHPSSSDAPRTTVPRIRRRSVLLAGAATALSTLSGCRSKPLGIPRPTEREPGIGGQVSGSTSDPGLGVVLLGAPQGLLADLRVQLARTLPTVMLSAGLPGPLPFSLLPSPPQPEMLYAIDLGPMLRQANFNPATVMLPELFSAVCTDLSHCVTTLVPESMRPIVVKYNPGAFEAAGFPPPSSTWTIDDFEAACSALQTALDHGKLASAGVAEVLYPFGGYAYDIETGTSTVTLGTLADPVLWQAFIAG